MNARHILIAIPAGLIVAGLTACGSGEAITGDGTGTAGPVSAAPQSASALPSAAPAGTAVQIADSGQPVAGPSSTNSTNSTSSTSSTTTSGSGKGTATTATPTTPTASAPSIHLALLDPPTCSPSTPKSPVSVRWTSRYATNVFLELMPPIVAPINATPLFLVSDEVPTTGTAVFTFDCSKPVEDLYGRAVGSTAPLADGVLAIGNNESAGKISPTTIKIKIP